MTKFKIKLPASIILRVKSAILFFVWTKNESDELDGKTLFIKQLLCLPSGKLKETCFSEVVVKRESRKH